MANIRWNGYIHRVRKTTLLVDDELLGRARAILGTKGTKDTIDRALDEVVRTEARRALIRRLETLDGLDLSDKKVMGQAWSD